MRVSHNADVQKGIRIVGIFVGNESKIFDGNP